MKTCIHYIDVVIMPCVVWNVYNAVEQGLFYRHSQRTEAPACPDGTSPVWTGYSLSFIVGNSRSQSQDLGN